MSAVKKDITQLLKKENNHRSNLTVQERQALDDLSTNEKIIIKPADKGGRIVIMDKAEYISACERDLSDGEFYSKLGEDPNKWYAEEVKAQAEKLLQDELISDEEFQFITAENEDPRTPLF